MEGQGIEYYNDGKIKFKGSYKKNLKNGKGTFWHSDGCKYKTDWENDRPLIMKSYNDTFIKVLNDQLKGHSY